MICAGDAKGVYLPAVFTFGRRRTFSSVAPFYRSLSLIDPKLSKR